MLIWLEQENVKIMVFLKIKKTKIMDFLKNNPRFVFGCQETLC